MTLKEHVDDIRNGLQEGQFTNEAQVSHAIVGRLLDALAWPRYNTKVVTPEYAVQGSRVDFALCHSHSKPIIFIEVKKVGHINEKGERQLFEYAFHDGVPVAILTDGKEWHFFYPSGQGNYKDRRVCKLNLIAGDSEENVARLDRYLNYDSIRTGEAIQAIADDYQNLSKQRQAEMSLPEAWTKLVQEEDEFLLEVVAEKTKDLCGYKPSCEKVLKFLRCLDTEKAEASSEIDTVPLPAPINLDEDSQERQKESGRSIAKDHPYFIEEWGRLFPPLRQRIRDIDSSVREEIKANYIVYEKNDKIFVRLGGTRGHFNIRLVLDVSNVEDPREMGIRNKHNSKWTTVVIAKIGNAMPNREDFTKPLYALDSVDDLDNISYENGDLDYLLFLIRQAFENN